MSTLRSLIAAVTLGLVAGAAAASDPAPAGPAPCRIAADLVALGGPLPQSSADVRDHRALRIVALGSSSTYGTGASGEAATYPARLNAELALLMPGVRLEVINKGVPGEAAPEMLERLDRDVIALAPDLVIWQTGTNDALRAMPLDEFAQLTLDGIGRLQAAGIDVVLMEPQYSPKLLQKQPGYGDYVDVLRTVASAVRAPVFRRYDVMKAWMANGQFVDATMLSSDSLHMKDASYACLGQVVAESVAGAITSTLQSPERLTAGGPTAR